MQELTQIEIQLPRPAVKSFTLGGLILVEVAGVGL
jgi:hypothetical protein